MNDINTIKEQHMTAIVTATHPLTGEVRKRTSKTMTYTHAVWYSIPEQTVHFPERYVPRTRNYLAHTLSAHTETLKADSGILSFHTSETAARKALQAQLSGWAGRGQYVKQDAGVVPVTKIK